ncbi:MAG: metallophosphoesterase [Bacteroidaceae bacterium]|nr:metallophosphoesterase [Bacteroidaceae bacterium]
MNRRTFLGGLAAIGIQGSLMNLNASPLPNMTDPRRQKKPSGRMDENLVVLISDMHVLAGSHTPARLTRVVNDILAMKPLPANVVGLGDLANLYGHVEDYECAREILKPLEDAGIKVTLGMGNHDRRGNFALIFPEKAAQTRLQGRMVFIVETPRADIIVLDSLQEDPDLGKWITPGAINEEQAQWLRNTLKGYSKPVFVSAHHPEDETKVLPILRECPACCGYIYGHEHHWHTGWPVFQWGKRDLMRTMCLPSTGYWGDIGYAVLNLGEDQATATLHQSDFFFNYPLKEGEEMPLLWSLMVKDNDGQKCSFSYRRPE